MNEWSPGGSYSRPGTPNQSGRTFRPQWEESEKGTIPLIVNIRAVSDNRSRSYQQHSMEDVSKTSLSIGNKAKKPGNGVSDPRFKKVISLGNQNDACMGTELKHSRPPVIPPEKDKSTNSLWSTADLKQNNLEEVFLENEDCLKSGGGIYCREPQEFENDMSVSAIETSNMNQQQDSLKAVDKLTFRHDIIVKSFSKESLSDCTVNTRNTSLVSEDLVDEFSNDLSLLPSATRVKKVEHWIQDQKSKIEKKQSLITVIGQMQGQDNSSSALREIDKRRKLVKELDKYAVCKKIIDADKEKEISNLMAKINCLSNAGKVENTKSKPNESNNTSNTVNLPCSKGSGDKLNKHSEKYEKNHGENTVNTCHEVSTYTTLPTSVTQNRSSSKKKTRKSHLANECLIKGKFREFFSHMQYQWIFCVMVILSGALFWITFLEIPKGAYVSFDLFTPKPKPMTWYEKICSWIWEIFRPSSNYRRTAPWQPY